MDADLSHPPTFIHELWRQRHQTTITIASRYVAGGTAEMPRLRYVLSRVLNALLQSWPESRGAGPIERLPPISPRPTLRGQSFDGRDFDILQEILVRALAEGWRIQEVPFAYAPRKHGSSHARLFRFGPRHLRRFWSLRRFRNSILAADYDDRAQDSAIGSNGIGNAAATGM